MRIIEIDHSNLNYLHDFISNLGTSKKHFRYFNKRDVQIVKQHVITLILLNDIKQPVCYGHLDMEDSIVWLGIAVVEGHQSKGYGKKMMQELISIAKDKKIEKIELIVDKENTGAINLYQQFGFVSKDEAALILKMVKINYV